MVSATWFAQWLILICYSLSNKLYNSLIPTIFRDIRVPVSLFRPILIMISIPRFLLPRSYIAIMILSVVQVCSRWTVKYVWNVVDKQGWGGKPLAFTKPSDRTFPRTLFWLMAVAFCNYISFIQVGSFSPALSSFWTYEMFFQTLNSRLNLFLDLSF